MVNNTAPEGAVFVDNACARTTLDRVRIENALSYGVRQRGGTLTVIDSAVLGTRHDPDTNILSRGAGIYLTCGVHAAMLDVLLDGNDQGLVVAGAGTDVTATALKVLNSTGHRFSVCSSGMGVLVRDHARLRLQVCEIRNNRAYGLRAYNFGHVEGFACAISGTVETPDAIDRCRSATGGFGLGAEESGTMDLKDFSSTDNALVGVLVAANGQLDLHHGVVSGNPIGANVQVDGYDLARLQDNTIYIDNDRNLDQAILPLPEPVEGIDLGDD